MAKLGSLVLELQKNNSIMKLTLSFWLIFMAHGILAQQHHDLVEKYEKLGVLHLDSNLIWFVPKNYQAKMRKVNFIVWFGAQHRTAEDQLQNFRLIEQLVQSEIPVVLVVPRIEYQSKFSKKMIKNLLPRISSNSLKMNMLILAGYDSGETEMAQFVRTKTLKPHEIWIFSADWELENYKHWLLHHKKTRFLNVYTDSAKTKTITEKMRQLTIQFADIQEENCTLGKLEKYAIIHIRAAVEAPKTPYLTGNFYKFILTSPVL